MELHVVSLDISGEFTETRFFRPTFVKAKVHHRVGGVQVMDVCIDKDLLAKLRTRSDLTSVSVEVEKPTWSTAMNVCQVFLPGETVTPTVLGPRDENGDYSYLRRIEDVVNVGRTSVGDVCGAMLFRVDERSGTIGIKSLTDDENQSYFPVEMLDEMIESLTMLRRMRGGATPAAVASTALGSMERPQGDA